MRGGMFDASCDTCGVPIRWRGELTDRPPCPRCGASVSAEVLQKDQLLSARMSDD